MCIYVNLYAATCEEGQCWCVSNGGRTCLSSNLYNVVDCDKDECWDKSTCNKNGHWCDDSLLSTSEGWCHKYHIITSINENYIQCVLISTT